VTETTNPAPTNSEIAAAFDELGDLYELDGASIHRIVAYRNGARAVREASKQVAQLALDGEATRLPGIGATLQEKIVALATTGEIPALVKLRSKFPTGLVEMTRLPGLGPKRARRLYEELGLDSLEALREAAEQGRISELKGFGPKAEQALLEAVAEYAQAGPAQRIVLSRALAVGEELLAEIRALDVTERAELAGSARRMGETVKDLDIVATATDPAALAAAVASLPQVEAASTPGSNAVRIRTHSAINIDVRIVEPDQFGNVLQHLTGSKQHNMALRDFAVRRGMHISEYGVLDDSTGTTHRCATEQEVYALLGMDYIEPELREDRGELDAALGGKLPRLVTAADLKGDLHCHTTASDGTASIEEMVAVARDVGYEYLVITDHSASMGFGADVSADELRRQIERVRELDATLEDFTLLVGSEVNILPDGSLDYADELLAELDWIVASVHTSFRMPRAEMTARIVHAVEHPHVDCIGHLSGRKILQRQPYEFDFEAVLDAARRTGTMLEINANPDRRDLNELHARDAAAAGIPLVINCDAHRTSGFEVVRYGIATARRAWLTPSQIANTQGWKELAAQRSRQQAA
jgi:DNA polymerase (family 10)